jgi:hypothetical protein
MKNALQHFLSHMSHIPPPMVLHCPRWYYSIKGTAWRDKEETTEYQAQHKI